MDSLLCCGFHSHGPYGEFQYLKLLKFSGALLSYYLQYHNECSHHEVVLCVIYRPWPSPTSCMRWYLIRSKQPPVSPYVSMEEPFSVSHNHVIVIFNNTALSNDLSQPLLEVVMWSVHLLSGFLCVFTVLCVFVFKWPVSQWIVKRSKKELSLQGSAAHSCNCTLNRTLAHCRQQICTD